MTQSPLSPRPRRALRLAVAALLALVLLALATALLTNRRRIDLADFDTRAAALVDRAAGLAARAADFDQDRVLRNFPPSPINGPVYRFDERWTDAVPAADDAGTSGSPQIVAGSVRFSFDGDDTHHFDPEYSEFQIDNGVLRFRYEEEKLLKSVEPFEIPWNDIASVRFRMKLNLGQHVEFAFARGLVPKRTRIYEPQFGIVTVDVIPDGEFHTYEVNARDAFEFNYGGIDKIQRLFFRASNVPGDEVEIDSIEILRRREKYAERPYGPTHETLGLDARPVLYMGTPQTLHYAVNVPANRPELRFGLGMLDAGDPVTFRVRVGTPEHDEVLFERALDAEDDWRDFAIPMDAWAGQDVSISLSVESAAGNIAFWSNPVLSGAPPRRFNVILLLEDTLRADHLSLYGHTRQTSPVKDALARESVVFDTAISQATETRPSCPALMTSLYPTSTGVWYFTDRLNDRFLTLPEILRSQGFETAAYIQNNHAGRIAGLHQGYSHFYERYSLDAGPQVVYSDRLQAWLDTVADRNFFLYLHVLDPHDPYEPKSPFDAWSREPSAENPGKAQEGYELDRSLYDGEILLNDQAFGEFMKTLERRGILDDTLVVFVSDHGEFFGEHGLEHHIPPAYAQVIHVPMLMRYPKRLPRDVRVKTPVGLIDVMPTILELAEVKFDDLLMQGDSLLPIIAKDRDAPDPARLIVTDDVRDMSKGDPMGWASVLFDRWHILNSRRYVDASGEVPETRVLPQSWLLRVYDYGRRPDETWPVWSVVPDLPLKSRFQRFFHDLHAVNSVIREGVTRGEAAESSYDPETLDRLRKLGYIQ